jgi:hypothetical protein
LAKKNKKQKKNEIFQRSERFQKFGNWLSHEKVAGKINVFNRKLDFIPFFIYFDNEGNTIIPL